MYASLAALLAFFPAQDLRVPRAQFVEAGVKPAPRAFADIEAGARAVDATRAEVDAAAPARAMDAASGALATLGDQLDFDVDAQGVVWARGATYKAAFSRQSARYIPFLGSRAPRNYPVDLAIESVTIGGEPLVFDAEAPAVRNGDVVEYARGPFVERYVLTPGSVEQTFVFDELPRRGEIVVTLALDTDLESASDARGLRFGNELGHVRYGEAFALHDELAPTRIETRLEAQRGARTIAIVAPAALVEGAVGRFVIDPVLTTILLSGTTYDEIAADTAYDLSNGVWLTVFDLEFSASDHDIRAVRHSTSGTVTAVEWVDFTADNWRDPAVANNNLDNQFLVVAARGASPTREIWGRTVEAVVALTMSAQFVINASFGDRYAPDVGGDPVASGPAYYAVVWEREFIADFDLDIHGRLVRTDTTLVGPGAFAIDDSSATHDTNVSISNSNGTGDAAQQNWNIVWQRRVEVGNSNIYGARLAWDGTLTDPTFPIAATTFDEINPVASGIVDAGNGIRPWMAAYQMDTASDGWDIRCRTFNGFVLIATFDLSAQFSSNDLNQITPSCDTDGQQFVVAYDERTFPVFFSTDVRVSTLFSLDGVLGINEGNLSVTPGLETDQRPRIVAAAASGSALDDVMVVFDRENGGHHDIWATGYAVPDGGPVSPLCSGDGSGTACPCGNSGAAGHGCASSVNPAGALLAHTGSADLTLDTLTLTSSGMPATASVLFFQGSTTSGGGAGSVFGDGLRCAAGTVYRLGTKTAVGGVASYPAVGDPDISVRGNVPATGAVRYYQAWYRNAAAFCTASTFNLTNMLRVQWIP